MTYEEFDRLTEHLEVLRAVAEEYGETVSLWCVIGQMEARVKWGMEHIDLLE